MNFQEFVLLASMLVIIFFLFSMAGWLIEVTLKYIQFHRFINRGFFIGPYCPIYGWGAVAVTVLVGGMIGRHGTIGETFLAGMFVCGVLEYFTSWYMEKLFHARWWDYSQKPMNLHGRIWIGNLLLFGAGSVVIVKWIDPVLFRILGGWTPLAVKLTALLILLLLLADGTISHYLMGIVGKEFNTQSGDNTEEISKKVHALLKEKGYFLRRIHDAYPAAQARSSRMIREWKAAKKKFKEASQIWKAEKSKAAKETRLKAQTELRRIEEKLFPPHSESL